MEIKDFLDYRYGNLWLDLSLNRFKDISKLKDFQLSEKVEVLVLSHNELERIQFLERFTKLEILYLQDNKISLIEGLSTLKKLKKLFLGGNKISKIQGLDNLLNLEELGLSNNKINEIEGLDNLKKLQLLNLQHNQVTEIKGLGNLENIEIVDLTRNNITKVPKDMLNISNNTIFLAFNPIYTYAATKLGRPLFGASWTETITIEEIIELFSNKEISEKDAQDERMKGLKIIY